MKVGAIALVCGALSWGCRGAPVESNGAREAIATAPDPTIATLATPNGSPVAAVPGWLGARIAVGDRGEALVAEVVPDTPAARAGMVPGDVVVGIGDKPVTSAADVNAALSQYRIGEPFELRFQRAGATQTARVGLEPMPSADELLRLRFVGKPAPSIAELTSPDGQKLRDGGLGRRFTVVEFWASWCGTCQLLAETLNVWHERYEERGVRILGVTRESPEVALPAAKQLMKYPVALDPDGAVSTGFDARTLPTVFVIDAKGTVVDVMRGVERESIRRIEARLDAR
jgi:thiol-disulfide isomerase/thioredoxin